MRNLVHIVFAVLIGAGATSAFGMALDYQGYAFETGGFPPSEAGDELAMPLIVTTFAPTFATTLGLVGEDGEITGWLSGLVSNGAQDAGDGVLMVSYSAGRVDFFRDPAANHDFGTLPPNATVPGTFTDGTLCLSGALNDFVLYFDPETHTGAFQGNLVFDTGECLKELGATAAEGFTFGGVLSPQAVGSVNVPEGYDLQVDGYLEAHKVGPEVCEFQCMGIDQARLDFKRHESRHFGPKDGKFSIEGGFLPCDTDSVLDPELLEVTLHIGEFQQVFPEGTLERHDRDNGNIKWEFDNERGTRTITDFEIRYDHCGSWTFEIEGRGIERSMLLPDDNLLTVELCIGTSCGTAEASLVQKRTRLRYHSKNDPCECDRRDDDDDDDKAEPTTTALAPELLAAIPNPFNATTTIALRTTMAGDVRVQIFDVRGRLVRDLQKGSLPAGEHRFVWRGDTDAGTSVASGVYIYRVDAPGLSGSRKLVVAK